VFEVHRVNSVKLIRNGAFLLFSKHQGHRTLHFALLDVELLRDHTTNDVMEDLQPMFRDLEVLPILDSDLCLERAGEDS
jgi:hypothetical protein